MSSGRMPRVADAPRACHAAGWGGRTTRDCAPRLPASRFPDLGAWPMERARLRSAEEGARAPFAWLADQVLYGELLQSHETEVTFRSLVWIKAFVLLEKLPGRLPGAESGLGQV